MDWLPISAAALLTGATALFFGAMMTPRPGGDGELLRSAQVEADNWIVLSVLLTVSAIGMVIGLPSLFTLFPRTGFRMGLLSAVLISVGCVLLAGFAQQLLLIRNLVNHDALTEQAIEALSSNNLQRVMLGAGFVVFYLGELALAVALFRARTAPRWVPWAFVAHVVGVLVGLRVLPQDLQGLPAILMTAGFVGVGVAANRTSRR